ncbi:MAG: protein kinase [Myxococcota bacterium]
MASSTVTLGPFALQSRVGSGGMAEVWRGIHQRQRVPVAVKVMTGPRAAAKEFHTAMRNEVMAVARLHHPNIVMVLDYGQVTREAEQASGGTLKAGSPYLAMELASKGTLWNVRRPMSWRNLRAVLHALLDALGHAHARGVIHRDLKPQNVLVCSSTDLRPGLKVTDFGIARPMDLHTESEEDSQMTGTPHYMAPEQFRAQWRDYGPWTDLYALGCMAYLFSTARLPFNGEVMALLNGHCYEEPPPLGLSSSFPRGFEQWVLQLLRKEPHHRFECVADAAWALRILEAESGGGAPDEEMENLWSGGTGLMTLDESDDDAKTVVGSVPPEHSNPDLDDAETRLTPRPSDVPVVAVRAGAAVRLDPISGPVLVAPPGEPLPTLAWNSNAQPLLQVVAQRRQGPDGTTDAHRATPPMPSSWRRTGVRAPSPRLLGAGLGLYGMRSIPMVDRDQSRDAVWAALRQVHETARARVVVLRGAAGNGKSRVAEWMTQRALELGVANVVHAVHGPLPGPAQGVARMISQHLQCVGLPRRKVLHRVQKYLQRHGVDDPHEWAALTEVICPAGVDETGTDVVRLGTVTERLAAVRRFLELMARERPLMVWIDDVQWGSEALTFVEQVLNAQSRTPSALLFLLTVREEALAERPLESQQLTGLLAREPAQELPLPPLDGEHHRKLVAELLGLEANLAEEVASRTAGNPLFAIQLVGDWVERGVLEVGPRGFMLRGQEKAILPGNAHEVWAARINAILEHQGPEARVALELAAVLGNDVNEEEWLAACEHRGVGVGQSLMDALIATRLVVQTQDGFHFVHGMLRESVERAAREGGRLAQHHLTAAAALRTRTEGPGVFERLGRHLVAAGHLEDALQPLLEGALARYQLSDYAQARAILELRERTMEQQHLPANDERWGIGWVLHARVLTDEGRTDDAEAMAERAAQQAGRSGAKKVLADAQLVLAQVEYLRGSLSPSRDHYEQARQLYATLHDDSGIAESLIGLGDLEYRVGHLDKAAELYQQALPLAENVRDVGAVGRCLWGLGYVQMWRGGLHAARALFTRQLRLFEEAGNRRGIAISTNALGELARMGKNWAEAEEHYRKSLAISEAIGSSDRAAIHLNLIHVILAREMFPEAERELDAVWPDLQKAHGGTNLVAGYAMRAVCLGMRGDWEGWDQQMDVVEAMLRDQNFQDGDLAILMRQTGERALMVGQAQRAKRALDAARAQWVALGREDRVAELDAFSTRLYETTLF